ncbi:hypothetical protein Mal15_66530 [Stieleria maiorica]|uniref:Uncharacterized protein n=1 Tax=Stieleria maiorica TaxID=2795974 RepID=A0A5B9MMA6_9BACT|nr:hypothetical protein Mal15_66530 [Stieleria maiorica]
MGAKRWGVRMMGERGCANPGFCGGLEFKRDHFAMDGRLTAAIGRRNTSDISRFAQAFGPKQRSGPTVDGGP